jgi:hypothetical protein
LTMTMESRIGDPDDYVHSIRIRDITLNDARISCRIYGTGGIGPDSGLVYWRAIG